jgi:TatD DNase family protein
LCVGLHPWRARLEALPAILALIRELHAKNALIAIGEIGLDFQPWIVADVADKATQLAVFRAQVALAVELDLPCNIHSTNAGHHCLDILRELGAHRAVMHAFDGRAYYAKQAIADLDAVFFSVPPCIVRSPVLQKLVARLPLSRLLLESDAPALGPVKGARNVPANICVSIASIARAKGVSADAVVAATTNNAHQLLGRKLQLGVSS